MVISVDSDPLTSLVTSKVSTTESSLALCKTIFPVPTLTISLNVKTMFVSIGTSVWPSEGLEDDNVGRVPGTSLLHEGAPSKLPSLFPSSSVNVVPAPLSLSIV